jgi:hypothetical protein
MRHSWTLTLCTLLVFCTALPAAAAEFSAGLMAGHGLGVGGDLSLEASRFAEGLPFSLRLGLGYGLLDPGDPLAARRIFINDNTNGTPEDDGHALAWRLDVVRELDWGALAGTRLFGGPRHASFTGTFNYIGGNEKFDVTSSHWGWGGGLERRWAMGPRWGFTLAGGADYYLASGITGHDTTISPDGEDVNNEQGYDYAATDEAINQPKLAWRLGLGLDLRLGR